MLATRERTPFPPTLVARLPRLRMFGLTGSRAALIDLAGMIERGITVCYTGGGPSVHSTAELALALMLAAARRIPQSDAAVRSGEFQLGTRGGFILAGKTIGLIGLGRIGAQMAAYCNALGMRVVAWSPNLTDERARAAGATRATKDELLAASDVVSLHLVLSDRTRGILGEADLARMKRGAILVNTSRGPLVNEAALIAAVQAGRVFAALDVYDREPLRARSSADRLPEHRVDAPPRLQRRRGLRRILRSTASRTRSRIWTASRCACSSALRIEPPMTAASLEDWFAILALRQATRMPAGTG